MKCGYLAAAPQGGGWKVLASTLLEGVLHRLFRYRFASLPWAMAIGRAWASDAVLTRVDVGRVSVMGVVDLGGETGQRLPVRLAGPAPAPD